MQDVFRFHAVLILILFSFEVALADERPNVLLLVSDDHRADVLGCAGHPIVQTPNLDRLALEGVRFDQAFVTTSICAASRASILTGLPESAHHHTFGRPGLRASLARSTYPARLRDRGYRTGFVGKFGIRLERGPGLVAELFDSFVPLTAGPYRKQKPDGSVRHVTDLIGDASIAFLAETPEEKPFCLSVSFNAGHAEDSDLEDHYPPAETEATLHADLTMPPPRLDDPAIFAAHPDFLRTSMNRDRFHWRWDTPEKYQRNLRDYFRLLAGMDRNIGRILAEIERLDRARNTVVIFVGDNGYYMGERGFAGKWSHYEESLRIPLVVFDPRLPVDQRGRVDHAMVLNLDLRPTILQIAGITEDWSSSPGRPLPIGTPAGSRDGFLVEHGMKHPEIPRWIGYREAAMKYARYLDHPSDGEFLHDLERDPDELVNLADHPDRSADLERLRKKCERAHQVARASGPSLPRVLLLGDSISMGYHAGVVAGLDAEAVVVRPKENCEGTTLGSARIDDWLKLDGGDFDLVHFNFGLHDLKRIGPGGTSSADPRDSPQADLKTYERQLRVIVESIIANGAIPVFATTTPVPEGRVRPHRDPEDVDRYNAVARRLMTEHGIMISDLHRGVASGIGELQRPVDVHFTPRGSAALAALVTRSIRDSLRRQ